MALAFVLGWAVIALLHPLFLPEATRVHLDALFRAPAATAWLGTDELGRSIAQRVLAGAALSCGIAVVAVAVSLLLGTAIGVLAAWTGGLVDTALARLIDVFMAFPDILLAIALAGVLGPGTGNVLIALGAVGWVGFARLARAQTFALKTREHVAVARALGVPPPAIVLRHVLPLAAAPLVVEASFALAAMIVAEAGLSFLGLGAQPPTPSWGSMIRQAMQYLLIAPHMLIGPCAALMSIAVSANLLGDRLRDRWQIKA
ncbi:MAG TPA: ABC transporter permease [Gammaproteobacteria bacterium]|nr:ABC transporter permease [Gammaproteobacteria bacterium]